MLSQKQRIQLKFCGSLLWLEILRRCQLWCLEAPTPLITPHYFKRTISCLKVQTKNVGWTTVVIYQLMNLSLRILISFQTEIRECFSKYMQECSNGYFIFIWEESQQTIGLHGSIIQAFLMVNFLDYNYKHTWDIHVTPVLHVAKSLNARMHVNAQLVSRCYRIVDIDNCGIMYIHWPFIAENCRRTLNWCKSLTQL